ncbi:hypothetical protein FF38_13209 [Lucilia cuprina]|uniref:Uncharacterized protein n=1 Tax=Lucilia cuprina TaxID=7375 RepID=A0A0L0CK78_LUCCU|nr:hypothetical protein FF38_13209 [Lucilia cuprina]
MATELRVKIYFTIDHFVNKICIQCQNFVYFNLTISLYEEFLGKCWYKGCSGLKGISLRSHISSAV